MQEKEMKIKEAAEVLEDAVKRLKDIAEMLAAPEPEPAMEPAQEEEIVEEIIAWPEKFDEDHPYDPSLFDWVDLGLPSGRLWAAQPAPGYYQYDEAVETFGADLPKGVAVAELADECDWTWNKKRKGYDVKGPNGNSIFIPALGWQDFYSATGKLIPGALNNVGSYGYWWTFSPSSQASARSLYFYSAAVYPLNAGSRAYGCSVLPSRESNLSPSNAARI